MTHDALAAGELLAKAKVSKLIGDAHRTQDYVGRTHGFIYSAGELVPLAAVVIGTEGISQEVGRARLDLLVEAVNALPTLAELTAANARVEEADKLDGAVAAFLAKYAECEPSLTSAFVFQQMHLGPYTGPNFGEELAALRKTLADREGRS